LVAALLFLSLSGCGKRSGDQGSEFNPQDQHIMQMAGLVGAYKSANNGKSPGSPDALKSWALKQPKDKLPSVKDSLDDVFISPRDKEPYQLAPPPTGMHAMGPPRIVVYEKTGVKGKHLIASGMGNVQELDDKALNSILEGPK
jgi:hypothetical protein